MTAVARVAVKICGLTRPDDAALAAALGARYVGVIMAGGPRVVDEPAARAIFAAAGTAKRAVVFGSQPLDRIAQLAEALALDVLQLHDSATPEGLAWLAARVPAARWAALGLADGEWPADQLATLTPAADAIVLDSRVAGRSGGTGVALPWTALAASIAAWRKTAGPTQFVLAGGLQAARVAEAYRMLSPDVLDVSSGVERAPGEKDPERLRAFFTAVEHA